MLPVCVPNPVAFPGIQLPSSLCRGSEQLRNLGCPERELNYWHKHPYTASHVIKLSNLSQLSNTFRFASYF